jgi:hypothetical protein
MPNPVPPQAYAPCRCGVLVLHGHTRDGTAVCLDPSQRTFVAILEREPKAKEPAQYVMVQSMAYPQHVCEQQHPGKD